MKNISYDLIEAFREAREAGVFGEEAEHAVLQGTEDSAYFYALSPDRGNLLEWYPWNREMEVLQLGAEYGALCGVIADRVRSFDILDALDENLEAVRFRYPEKMKEKGGNVGLMKYKASKRYDVVILLLSSLKEAAERDMEGFLQTAAAYLRKGGSLIFAAENGAALKYAAGAEKETERIYPDAEKLFDSCSRLPFTSLRRYYPLPNADFAKNIYSDAYLPKAGAFRDIADSYTNPRYVLCDEALIYGRLSGAGAFPLFAPSYLMVAEGYRGREEALDGNKASEQAEKTVSVTEEIKKSGGREAAEQAEELSVLPKAELPLYVRYNRSRLPAFCIKTEILEAAETGCRQVKKTALSEAADEHIASFSWKYALLQKAKGIETYGKKQAKEREQEAARLIILEPKLSKTPEGRQTASFPYIEGETLSSVLAAEIRDGRAPEGKLKAALERLMGPGIEPCHNLDLLFENVMVAEGQYYLLDYEWVFENELDRDYVKYRILRYFYEAYREELYAYENLAEFLQPFGIRDEILSYCEAKELSFQLFVHGEDKGSGELRFQQPTKTFSELKADAEKLLEFTEWNLRLQDEVEEHKTMLKKEREIERLSQNHIRNIEKIRETQGAQIEAMQAELLYLRKHQSLWSRLFKKMVAAIDERAPQGSKKRKLIQYAKGTVLHPAKYLRLYLTKEGRNDIAGDFDIGGEYAEGGKLKLPPCRHLEPLLSEGETAAGKGTHAEQALESPLVSIIIPAYNQVAYTYACLRSIIQHTDFSETPYEVILADDVSTDATEHISRYVEGLVISRNTENQGFLKNCNRAAEKAAGKYIFFLNNDTKVTEGWLESLVRLIESDAGIGMVGSRLIYPDGRLQEAGGIIWSDASGWNYGRLDDPGKPEYNYVKDVDYISGAAIMLKKSLWDEIGGFDERYAPAYCEDSDLAFEVRKRGLRVVLEPKSVIVHFEGISNGTDVEGTGLKRYQVVNQETFREKWKEALKKQSVNDGNPNPFAARDRSQHKPCVLIIDHYVPTWDKDAGSKTTYQYIQMFLKKGYNVKFLGDNFLHEEPYSGILQEMGVEVLYGEELQNNIFDWIEKNKDFIDFAYLNRPHIAVKYIDYLKEHTNIKCIYYGHDLHFMRLGREYELSGDIRTKREAEYWKGVEFSVMRNADMVYYPSEAEINAIHSIDPSIPAKAITAYVWDAFLPEALSEEKVSSEDGAAQKPAGTSQHAVKEAERYEKREGLLFVGGFAHPPNADGVLWFANRIFPRIRKAIPDICFYIAGSKAGEEIKALGENRESGIEVLGFVSDARLEELYRETKLVVVPLRYGAGVKGKVVEALYNGAVIVTTSVGAEGIPEAETVMALANASDEEIYEAAEKVEAAFAEAVIRLYTDAAEEQALRRKTGSYIRAHYSMDAAWEVIKDDFSVQKK